MNRMQRIPVVPFLVLVLVAPLAGCLGSDADVDAADDDIAEQADDAIVTATTGSIRGTVGSDLFEPLAGAIVTIVETGAETIVAKNGGFVFNDLEPGRYTLIASAPTYQQGKRAVAVTAGEISPVSFRLALLASDGTYVDFIEHSAIITYGAAWTAELPVVGCLFVDSPTVPDVPDAPDIPDYNPDACGQLSVGTETQPPFTITEDVQSFLVEMVWSSAGPLGEYLKMDLVCPLVPRGLLGQVADEEHVCYFPTTSRDSPIIHRIDQSHWIENDYNFTGEWTARAFPSYGTLGTHDLAGIDFGVTYEQRFTVYISIFHRHEAPDGYTGIPDV